LASALYGDMKLAEVLPEVSPAGCAGLDLWGKPHATHREEVDEMGVDAFEALLKQSGVPLVCSTRYPLGPFGLQPEMPMVKRLGGKLIVCASKGPKDVTGVEAKAGIKEFLELMKPHADAAAGHGITIAIENHAGALLASPDSLRYWAEFNTHPALGVALAPHHLHDHVDDLPKLIRELGAKNLPFVYFQEYGIGSKQPVAKEIELQQLPGYGTLDYRPILKALREVSFEGFVEIFMHPTPRGAPILPTPAEITAAINRSRGHIEGLLQEVNA
ncbi:MAG: sugar phosphate isomerase/epimerase family protein, partial [Verrucomicrobiales bacterium]